MLKGYKRPEEMTDKLSWAIEEALSKYPHLRFGTLISILITDVPEANYRSRLNNIYDEDIYSRLQLFDKWKEAGAPDDWVTYLEKQL